MPKKRKKGSFSMSSRYFFVICSECRMTKEANLPASEKKLRIGFRERESEARQSIVSAISYFSAMRRRLSMA